MASGRGVSVRDTVEAVVAVALGVLLSGGAANVEALSSPAPGQAVGITIICRPGWIVDFHRDGRVHAQFGSLPGDGASVPEGTVGFDALLSTVQRLRVETKLAGVSQVAILRERETSTTAFYISDDTVLRSLIASLRDTWKQDAGGTRFHELLAQYPICP